MGWGDIPPFWSVLMAALIPLHLFDISGSWLFAGIQLFGFVALVVVGIRYVRTSKKRAWYFCLGYPLVIFVTNVWVLLDEIAR
jgi:hypothetical protein